MEGSRGNDKAPCDKCNLVVPEEKSAICSKCKKREHLSCMHNPPQDPEYWLCENCSTYGTGKTKKTKILSLEDLKEDKLRTEVNKSGKNSWKLPAMCQGSKRNSSGGNPPMSRNSSLKERMSKRDPKDDETKREKKPFLSLPTLSIFKRKDSSSLKSLGVSPSLSGKNKSISKQESQMIKGKRTFASSGKGNDQEKKQHDLSKRMKQTGIEKGILIPGSNIDEHEERDLLLLTGPKKGISIPGSNIDERKHSDAEERDLIHAFSSLYLHRPDRRPAERATWDGCFLVHHDPALCYYSGDLEGRSTGKVHCETYQFSQRLASYIHFNVLERSSVWHGLFQEDDEELALYFLPKDVKSQTNYQILLDLVDKNLLLISPIHTVDAELMVFSSRLLHPNAKRAVLQYEKGKELATSKGIDFLCGIFLIGPKRVGVFLQ